MKSLKLKKEIDESTVVKVLVDVNKVRKISQQQLNDILSVTPNYLPTIVEKTNQFLEKMAHLVKMYKLQEKCENMKYAKKHPEEVDAVEKYFKKDEMRLDRCWEDIVELWCMYAAIGKFCISTKKFFKEIAGTQWENKNEMFQNILQNLDQELKEHEEDVLDVNRYAHRFFRTLLKKNKWFLPHGITADDMAGYIKMYVYDDELNR